MGSSSSDLNYRDAELTDLSLIVAIYNSTIASRMVTADTTPVSVASKLSWFENHNKETRPLWLAVDPRQAIIGWLSFQSFYGRPAYNGTVELSIYLDEKYRGKGYGKQILQHAVQQAPKLGVHTILAFIFAHNVPSIKLFKNEGFAEWGNFPDVAVLDGIYRSLLILGRKV